MPRIAFGGFMHETNTFAPVKAEWRDFLMAKGWPALTRGEAMFDVFREMNIGTAGAMSELLSLGHALVPLSWCGATPSSYVTDEAFEKICAILVNDLVAALEAGSLNGIYLDLHGAATAESFEDAEGELLRRVRAVVGPEIPIVASLDLHANVTRQMVEMSDALVAYRTYPHVDMEDTGRRAARVLDRLIRRPKPWFKSFRQINFLIPVNWGCTLIEPAQSIYRHLDEIEAGDNGVVLSFAPGFPATDIADCGASVFGYAATEQGAEAAVRKLADEIESREAEFAGKVYTADEAVAYAMAKSNEATRPFVLADTQDNPGAGGNSDTVGILESLVRLGAQGAVLAVLYDPEAAEAAHRAAEGAELELAVGARSKMPGHNPFRARFRVEKLGDGNFVGTGPMWRGARMALGPMALLRVLDGGGDVRVVVASRKQQAADQAIFRHLGIEPSEQKILVLKSSVHFRADFQPIAEEILVVEAPGPMPADPAVLPWTRLRDGLRVKPRGRPFVRSAVRE
jgi:microcystin degradation protein MlrC